MMRKSKSCDENKEKGVGYIYAIRRNSGLNLFQPENVKNAYESNGALDLLRLL